MSPKTVKRYANRKLYDTERSCYVTLEDIAGMIKAGEEVRVVDNKSGEDLTSVTLAQIIFETEKKKSFMSLDLLRDLIRNGGDSLSEFARQRVDRVQAAAADIRDTAKETAQKLRSEFEEKIERLTHRKAGEGEVVVGTAGGTTAAATATATAVDSQTVHAKLHELVAASQKSFDELQDRIKSGVGNVSRYANLGKEVEEIRQRLATLEDRLGKM